MTPYLVPTSCPACYWRGWVPVLPGLVRLARDADPDAELLPTRCANRHCQTDEYPVTARDVARARPKDVAA